jgi:predicted transcriptional regulator
MPSRASEPLLVRIDPETRQTLVAVATSSDRTLSQLVRYATLWWIHDDARACLPMTGGQLSRNGGFVNVRFASDDMTQVRHVATALGLERGAVVRQAIRAWVAAGDFTALGDPRHVTAGPETPVMAS